MFFVFSLLAGRLVPRYGTRVLLLGGIILVIGYGAAGLVLSAVGRLDVATVLPLLMLQSIGGGLVITPALIRPTGTARSVGRIASRSRCARRIQPRGT